MTEDVLDPALSDPAPARVARSPGRGNILFVTTILCVGVWIYAALMLWPAVTTALGDTAWADGPTYSDIWPRWYGTWALFHQGTNPYSPEVTVTIQQGMYGHVLAADDPIRDRQGFAYPLYTVFVLAPLTLLPFLTLKPWLYPVLLALVGLATLGWLRAYNWPLGWTTRLGWGLLSLSALPTLTDVALQQPTVLTLALLAGAAAAITRRWYGPAGVLIAVAMIKPQLCVPFLLWWAIWVTGDWRARRGVAGGFAVGMMVLLVGSLALVPGWLVDWVAQLQHYREYTAVMPSAIAPEWALTIGAAGYAWVNGLLLLSLALWAWRTRRAAPGDLRWNISLAAAGVATTMLVPGWAYYNHVFLYPALILLWMEAGQWATGGSLRRGLGYIWRAVVVWPWAIVLVVLPLAVLGLVNGSVLAALALLPWIAGVVTPWITAAALALLAATAQRSPAAHPPLAGP